MAGRPVGRRVGNVDPRWGVSGSGVQLEHAALRQCDLWQLQPGSHFNFQSRRRGQRGLEHSCIILVELPTREKSKLVSESSPVHPSPG